ncbi:MAG: SoxR reducing system RseC family protein [Proteobacteria bacterium]|nr:SoxR reducing system RseC family protein [Pseudomonadota bacterium]
MSVSCQETGQVIGLAQDGRAVIKIRRAEACHSCSAKSACHALGGETQDMKITVVNTLGARPGDQVVLSLSELSIIKASAVLYLLPALCLIGGAVIGAYFAGELGLEKDPASIVGSLAGLGLGLGLTWIVGNQMGKKTKYLPKLEAIAGQADQSSK